MDDHQRGILDRTAKYLRATVKSADDSTRLDELTYVMQQAAHNIEMVLAQLRREEGA